MKDYTDCPGIARIAGISTALPPHRFEQDAALGLVEKWLEESPEPPELPVKRVAGVFRNSKTETRYSVLPIEDLFKDTPFCEKNRLYMENAKTLGEEALTKVFDECGVDPSEIDLFITTSCTGFMIPSVDAYLMNLFHFRDDVKRLPITELGCASGVTALRTAYDYLRGWPGSTVLVLSIELCSLNFHPEDVSADHIISTAIFGDGAAAMVVTDKPRPGLQISKTKTHFFPDTLDFMGFDVESTGFHIFLSRSIPGFVKQNLCSTVKPFLSESCHCIGDIDAWLFHPGGLRILEGIEKVLSLDEGDTFESREVLRRYGNLSSATILFVLDTYIRQSEKADGAHQVIGAVGPGFQLELALAEWRE